MKSSKYTAKNRKRKHWCFLRPKEKTRHIFEKIIDDFNESQDEIYVEHLEVPNPDQELQIRAVQGKFPGHC